MVLINVQERTAISRIESMVQPLVRLNGQEDAVCHFEVLSRFYTEEGEYISPNKIFDNPQNSSAFYSLDKKIFRNCMREFEILRNKHRALEFRIGVNVSERSVARIEEYIDFAMQELSRSSLSANQIVLEVNEKAREGISDFCEYASLNGFGLAIDDLGAQHSTMGKIKHEILPYLEGSSRFMVKIDQSFIKKLFSEGYSYKRTDNAFIDMALALREDVPQTELVAEGIETEEISKYLAKKGIDFGQGYHYARPMTFEKYSDWLKK